MCYPPLSRTIPHFDEHTAYAHVFVRSSRCHSTRVRPGNTAPLPSSDFLTSDFNTCAELLIAITFRCRQTLRLGSFSGALLV